MKRWKLVAAIILSWYSIQLASMRRSSWFLAINDTTYRKCDKYEDTNGKWQQMHLIYRNQTVRHDMLRHFYGGGPKEAIKFTNIWLPFNCSYHRFTNETVDKCIVHLLTNHQRGDHSRGFHQHNNSNHRRQLYDIDTTSHNFDNNRCIHSNECIHQQHFNYSYNRNSSSHHDDNKHHDDHDSKYFHQHHEYGHPNSSLHNSKPNQHYSGRRKLRIVFFGDSATRGIINGITRILSGSEIYGPCISDICGRPGGFPPSEREHNQHRIYTYRHMIITFIYTKSLTIPFTIQHIESIITENKTYAIVLNTGAWDFDHVARAYKNHTAIDECGKQAMKDVSKLRTSSSINESMWRFSALAEKYHTRIIYRNNHYNRRFGTICADAEFEAMIAGSNWEIWDNRMMSKDSWVEQTYDGFHFDRNRVHSEQDHKAHRGYFIAKDYEKPGQLEIQFAQSLLQSLFYDCIVDDNF